MVKLLVHGHVPKWFGGKQVSGLSNVMFCLAEGMSLSKRVVLFFNATDIRRNKSINSNFKLLGWDFSTLLTSILVNFFSLLPIWLNSKYIVKSTNLKSKINIFCKRLIFNYRFKLIKPNIVHFHGIDFFMFEDLINDDTPIIVTIHHLLSNDNSVAKFKKYRSFEGKLISNKKIKKIYFVSSQVKDEATQIGNLISNKVVLNGIDTSVFKYKNINLSNHNKELKLCTVGSICERKGQKRVVEASLKLKSFDKITYYLIGGGDPEYINEIKNISLNSSIVEVKYLGVISTNEIVDIYSKSHFMILASIKEGFGMTTIESISCGTKAIVTKDNPLVDEGLLNNLNSILIENHTVESIVSTLENLKINYDKKIVSQTVSSLNWLNQAKYYEEDILSFGR